MARGGGVISVSRGLMLSYGLELDWADLLLVLGTQVILEATIKDINVDC